MKPTLLIKVAFLAIVAFCLAGNNLAQGKGKPPQDKGQTTQQQDRDRISNPDRDRAMGRDQARDQDRDRIRLNETQADQLKDQLRNTDQTRDRLRKMLHDYDQAGFNATQGNEYHMRIREQFRNMEQDHQQFMNGMDSVQRNRWQKRIMNMEQQQERITNRLQLMEQEMNSGQFDRIRQRNWVREIDRAMKEWREQYRKVQHEGEGTD